MQQKTAIMKASAHDTERFARNAISKRQVIKTSSSEAVACGDESWLTEKHMNKR
jgi:hypothetical protein